MSPGSTDFVQQFTAELEKPTPTPELLALYVAGMAYPQLNVAQNLALLDEISATVYDALVDQPPGRARAEHFLSVLKRQWRFSGNRSRYYDPRNSFLNEVLERRTGLPITLSLLCIAVGQRLAQRGLDLAVRGVGLPGHFMAVYRDAQGEWLLDPFNGKVLAAEEAAAHLSHIFKQPVQLTAEAFEPVSTHMLIYRMLNNLRLLYLDASEYAAAIAVLNYMIVLTPDDDALWKERGLLHYYTENWPHAARDLRHYFFMQGLLLFALGAVDEDGPIGIDEDDLEFGILDADDAELDAADVDATEAEYDEAEYDEAEYDEAEYDDEYNAAEYAHMAYSGIEYESVLDELTAEDQQLLQILGEVEELRTRLN
ncbi:MAG: transglutaminase-like domain-containing protein [Caldilineaceae bacterium]